MKDELITFSIEIEAETEPLKYLFDRRDANEDTKKEEKAIRYQLKKGNLWAWCTVRVVASFGIFLAKSSWLGCCSYSNEAEFVQGSYYDDMKKEAMEELLAIVKAGKEAFDALEL